MPKSARQLQHPRGSSGPIARRCGLAVHIPTGRPYSLIEKRDFYENGSAAIWFLSHNHKGNVYPEIILMVGQISNLECPRRFFAGPLAGPASTLSLTRSTSLVLLLSRTRTRTMANPVLLPVDVARSTSAGFSIAHFSRTKLST